MIDLATISALEPKQELQKTYSVIWTPDLIDNDGDVDCKHNWINGKEFQQPIDEENNQSLGRILPRICDICNRKEYLFEHITELEQIENIYSELQKVVIIKKGLKNETL